MLIFLKKYLASISTKIVKNMYASAFIYGNNFNISLFYKHYKEYKRYDGYIKDYYKRKLKIEIAVVDRINNKDMFNYFCFEQSFNKLQIINKYFFLKNFYSK